MKTIQYKEFPKKVRSFIESYFFDLFLKNKSLKDQLNLLHISSEILPETYPKFVKAEFSPPYKISYFGNNINWGGVIHDTTHFLQYHTNKEEFEKERQLLKVATFSDYAVYYENKFEKEAFAAQEEFNKYTSLKFSTFYPSAWITPDGVIHEVDDHAVFAVESILSPYGNVNDVNEEIIYEIINKLHKQGWIRVSGVFPDFIGVSLYNLTYEKKKRIEDYLIKYEVHRDIRMMIDDQQSLGSMGFDGAVEEFFNLETFASFSKLSWKIMSDVYYDFEELLRNNGIHFKTKDGIITIDHNGYVSLDSLTQLPDNVQFNNKGDVYLYSLTQLPDNVQFNNKGYVSLPSLTQLPDNVQFNNNGYVNLSSLTQLPDNVQFNNKGYVNLYSLTQLLDNVIFNNKGNVYLNNITQLPDNVQFNNNGYVNLSSLTQLPDNKEQIFRNDGIVYYDKVNQKYDPRTRKLSWQSGKDSYKDLSFNYDKDRGQQIDEYEVGEGGSSALSPLLMKQPWNTENLVTDIDQDELKEKSLNWQDRSNTQLWI